MNIVDCIGSQFDFPAQIKSWLYFTSAADPTYAIVDGNMFALELCSQSLDHGERVRRKTEVKQFFEVFRVEFWGPNEELQYL